MSIRIGAIGPVAIAANPASLSTTIPGAIGQREFLVAWARRRTVTITPPLGWDTAIDFQHPDVTDQAGRIAVYTRVRQAWDLDDVTVGFSGTVAGTTCIVRGFSLTNVKQQGVGYAVLSASNLAQANIGPIPIPPLVGADGAVVVIGAKSDDWTSVDTLSADAGVAWSEGFENPTTTGGDGGLVFDIGVWSGQPPSIPSKTFVVNGGSLTFGIGVAIAVYPAVTENTAPALVAQPATISAVASSGKTASGALTAQAATTAGTGLRTAKATVGLAASPATVVGTGERTVKSISAALVAGSAGLAGGISTREIYATGTPPALIAQEGEITSGEIIEDIGTEAVLYAGSAVISTDAIKLIFSITADLASQEAIVQASNLIQRNGAGALVAQAATLFGSSSRVVYSLNAALAAGSGALAGDGDRGIQVSAALAAQSASISAIEVVERKGTGALAAGVATTAAVGGPHPPAGGSSGAGELAAGAAVLAAGVTLERKVAAALVAESASVTATVSRVITVDADLFADFAGISADVQFGDIATWDSDDQIWGQPPVIHARSWPVFVKGKSFYQAEITNKFNKNPVRVILERTGLTILGRDRQGNWKTEPGTIKFITGVWPLFRGAPGAKVNVYVGGQMATEEPIRWEGPYECVIGETTFMDFTVSGRYISLRFESVGQPMWELVSYDLELTAVGSR